MGRPVKRIQADTEIVKELQRRARAATSTVRERERANIVLLRLDGKGVEAVAEQLGTTAKRVSVWSKRFEEKGLPTGDEVPHGAEGRLSSRLHAAFSTNIRFKFQAIITRFHSPLTLSSPRSRN